MACVSYILLSYQSGRFDIGCRSANSGTTGSAKLQCGLNSFLDDPNFGTRSAQKLLTLSLSQKSICQQLGRVLHRVRRANFEAMERPNGKPHANTSSRWHQDGCHSPRQPAPWTAVISRECGWLRSRSRVDGGPDPIAEDWRCSFPALRACAELRLGLGQPLSRSRFVENFGRTMRFQGK